MILFWVVVFIVSLAVLVKGADLLLKSAEKIGLALGLSPFVVGVLIVGAGTSFPELISSLVAAFRGIPEFVAANAIGSNIANILLIVGVAAILGRKLSVTKNLIDIELPLLSIGTAVFLGTAWDGAITLFESALLLFLYGVYFLYTVFQRDEEAPNAKEAAPGREQKRSLAPKDFFFLFLGVAGLALGSKYLIDSVISLSELLHIATGVIAISAVALGTSLPELLVSGKAALQKKSEVALGNIFGSNAFNIMVVVGLPGLFRQLPLDEQTFHIGLPVLAVATLLFVISGISRRIHLWEGAFYIALYVLFISKLFGV